MQVDHQESAMTEISLALAMAFFSIMVLTMVSMGVGDGENSTVAAANIAPTKTQNTNSATTEVAEDDLLVIYHNDKFFDRQLNVMSLANIQAAQGRRVILAIDPHLPLSKVIQVRTQISTSNIIVSTLDQRWLKALGE